MSGTTPRDNLDTLRRALAGHGVDLLSSAALTPGARAHVHEAVRAETEELGYALVIGMRLSRPALETCRTAPTWTYYYHYRTVNFALDQAAFLAAGTIQRMGRRAFPVPASQILDWDRLRAHLSHREIGELAGLGWRGRNNLLVHPGLGAQFRLVTVLTDLELPAKGADLSLPGCGACRACIDACPAGAIGEDASRFDADRCTAQLRRFTKSEKINTMICGVCVRVCQGAGPESGMSNA